LIAADNPSAISAVAKRCTYSILIQIRKSIFNYIVNTNLALSSYNHQVCEDIELLHHHLTDPPDLDRKVIVEEMIQKY
jgi:hypothetical protein